MNKQIKLVRTLLILALVVSLGRLFTLKTGQDWLQSSQAYSTTELDDTNLAPVRTVRFRPQDLAQNPLFESFDADDSSTPVLQARTAEDFGYELIGTLVTSTSLSRAIFRSTKNLDTVICQLHDNLDAATILEIQKDRVVLQERQGERFVLIQSDYQGSIMSSLSSVSQRHEIPARTYPGEQFYSGLETFFDKATLHPRGGARRDHRLGN